MNNFSYRNTTRIHLGQGQIAKIKDEIPAEARGRSLFCTNFVTSVLPRNRPSSLCARRRLIPESRAMHPKLKHPIGNSGRGTS